MNVSPQNIPPPFNGFCLYLPMALVNYPLAPTSEKISLDFNHCDKYDDNDGYFDKEGGLNQLSPDPCPPCTDRILYYMYL